MKDLDYCKLGEEYWKQEVLKQIDNRTDLQGLTEKQKEDIANSVGDRLFYKNDVMWEVIREHIDIELDNETIDLLS